MRVAVLGANGQVGAELCLLLARQEKVELVPICRTRFGSAFLRSRGVPCRHGDASDEKQAPRLFGDCDVIADLALAGLEQDYRNAMAIHDRLIRNVARYAKPGSTHIYFSTMSVYGDARMHQWIAVRNLYGREKARCERVARRAGTAYGHRTFIFRLGHVCGELQGITREIRRQIAQGPIPVPDLNRLSNTVHVATIVDAILKVAAGAGAPGTYDLMNKPQWTWKQVFEYEGQLLGIAPTFIEYQESAGPAIATRLARSIGRRLMAAAAIPLARKVGSRLMALLPSPWYRRVKAEYSIRAAGAEIAKLAVAREPIEAVLRRPVGSHFLDALELTADLLHRPEFHLTDRICGVAWPSDLPLCEEGPSVDALSDRKALAGGVTHA